MQCLTVISAIQGWESCLLGLRSMEEATGTLQWFKIGKNKSRDESNMEQEFLTQKLKNRKQDFFFPARDYHKMDQKEITEEEKR